MSRKKALVVTTVASTIDQFCMNDIKVLKELGYTVHVYANFTEGNNTSTSRIEEFKQELQKDDIIINEANLNRSPFSKSNIIEYFKLKKLLKREQYTVVHCHTPIASVVTRLAANEFRKQGLKVIYTAHGFHFFKGAPLVNWILYYPLEIICSRFTDILITINQEDFNRAKTKMRANTIKKIPGVGINTENYINNHVDVDKKRKEIGISDESVVLLSVGELNKNKNHEVIIKALKKINNPTLHYYIAGKGQLESYLKDLINSLGLNENVHLLGYRTDIMELCKVSDIFCFPSQREGLGLAAIEAMATGLPLVTSNIHGINDYSQNGVTGYSTAPNSVEGFIKIIDKLSKDKILRENIKEYNQKFVKRFDVSITTKIMTDIYKGVSD